MLPNAVLLGSLLMIVICTKKPRVSSKPSGAVDLWIRCPKYIGQCCGQHHKECSILEWWILCIVYCYIISTLLLDCNWYKVCQYSFYHLSILVNCN